MQPDRSPSSAIPDLAEALAAGELQRAPGGLIPLFNAASVAAALVDRTGAVVHATAAFGALHGERLVDPEMAARAAAGAAPATVSVELQGSDGQTSTAIFAYAPAGRAAGWQLPPDLREAAERSPGHAVVLTSGTGRASQPLEDACRAYGLNGLQTRVVMETIRTGSVKAAALAAGVSYHTARDAMAEAMKRARAPRLPALVTSLTTLAFGVLPQADAAAVLEDLWGLTPRQAAIAVLAAGGASRAAVAGALAVGEAVVRKELERIHQVLQVSTGAELARKVVEANALRWLTEATSGDAGFVDPAPEPLHFVHRPDGRRIAISDYGPASGVPLLVSHTGLTHRIVSRRLVRALHAAGYRPIAIDRPGFGLSDEVAGAAIGEHDPFVTAAADAITVLDHLRIRRVDLVARGAAQFVLALARAAPERLGRVVLINPPPPIAESGVRTGPVGRLKAIYQRNPGLIRLVTPFYSKLADFDHFCRRLLYSARGSPPDEAAMSDPEMVGEYFRAMRPFLTGRTAGYVNELTALAKGHRDQPVAGSGGWRVLMGAHDFMHDPERVLAYWRPLLPDASFQVVPDAGRYLSLTHSQLVVDALAADAS